MFTKDYKKDNDAERLYWAQTRAQGKRRFIFREMVLNIILWVGISVVLAFTERPTSVQSIASTAIIMLPVFLLGGYLSAKWKWSEFEKKYPE